MGHYQPETAKTIVVLLSNEEAADAPVDQWLRENGYITWKANDVGHALEELSDFTVAERPDVVLLPVSSLAQRFETLRSALRSCVCEDDMTVVAFDNSDAACSTNRFFAHDLKQFRTLIDSAVQPHVCTAA